MTRLEGKHRCESPEATERIAEALARTLRPGDFVALRGELGAGKTRFVRGLARGLGHSAEAVSSPTYVLVHEYETPGFGGGGTTALVHIDAYRLKSAEDADSIGWDDVLAGGCVVAVEWPERVEARLPARRVEVFIDHAGEMSRDVTISRVEPAIPARPPRRGSGAAGACRTCGGALGTGTDAGAFCSERCRLADLNKWFSGEYRVTRELKDSDLEEGV